MIPIVRVLAPNPSVFTLEGTNTWVVGRDPTIVIDPGPAIASHLDEVVHVAGRVAHVLVTHDHEDHAEGARALAEAVGAPLRAWRLDGAEHLRDGQAVEAGDVSMIAVHAPGHSGDHVVFFAGGDGALFTGDAVLGRGTSFVDPPDGDLTKYLGSLQRMVDLGPRTIYPGHGPVVLDAPAKLREYLDHRAEREQQVLDGLADGVHSVHDLVSRIYADHPPEVHPLAARSVTAHLQKLASEGRAVPTGRGEAQTWAIAEPKTCARCGRPVRGRARYCSSCSLIMLQESGPAS